MSKWWIWLREDPEIVEPNIAALAADFGNFRHNLSVVHTVEALAARIYYASNGMAPGANNTAYRAKLATRHPEIAPLRDIAKAIKHVRLDRGHPKTKRGDKEVRSLRWDEAVCDGRWDSPLQVVIPLGCSVRVIETVALNALNVLKAEMAESRAGEKLTAPQKYGHAKLRRGAPRKFELLTRLDWRQQHSGQECEHPDRQEWYR